MPSRQDIAIFFKVTPQTLFAPFFSVLKLQALDSKNGIYAPKVALFQNPNSTSFESEKQKKNSSVAKTLHDCNKIAYFTENRNNEVRVLSSIVFLSRLKNADRLP